MRRRGAHHPLRDVRIVTVVEPPEPLVTVAQMNTRLRLDLAVDSPMSDEDQEIADDLEAMIASATSGLDGPGGRLNRCLGPQTLELSVQGCGQAYIELPYPPFIEVVSVSTVDDAGDVAEVSASTYAIRRGAVYFAAGAPDAADLRIRYRAGYADGASPPVEAVPKALKQAIKLMVGDMWQFRESAAAGTVNEIPMSATVRELTGPFVIFAI